MEERTQNPGSKIIRVVITGPECTGKSTLAIQLAKYFSTEYIPEYAREYIGNLGRSYEYDDLVHIAEVQLKQSYEAVDRANKFVFLDTFLIITKVWFEVVYGHYPLWIDEELARRTIDLYLLCNTNIPWVADPVRENGGEMREKLYHKYQDELERLGCHYVVIGGIGKQRLEEAVKAIHRFFPDLCH